MTWWNHSVKHQRGSMLYHLEVKCHVKPLSGGIFRNLNLGYKTILAGQETIKFWGVIGMAWMLKFGTAKDFSCINFIYKSEIPCR